MSLPRETCAYVRNCPAVCCATLGASTTSDDAILGAVGQHVRHEVAPAQLDHSWPPTRVHSALGLRLRSLRSRVAEQRCTTTRGRCRQGHPVRTRHPGLAALRFHFGRHKESSSAPPAWRDDSDLAMALPRPRTSTISGKSVTSHEDPGISKCDARPLEGLVGLHTTEGRDTWSSLEDEFVLKAAQ